MKKYNLFTFLENVDKIGKDVEDKHKKQELGKIVSSLQRPFKEVLQSVCEKQVKDVNNLLKALSWLKSNSK